MSIIVNIWLPTAINVGHASAKIGCDGEEFSTYVSWWPSDDPTTKSPGCYQSECEDLVAEKRKADVSINIEGLDEERAARWWREFRSSGEALYGLSDKNCSWAVVSALKAGGSDKLFPWHQKLESKNLFVARNRGGMFHMLASLLAHTLRLLSLGAGQRFAFLRPLVNLGDRYSPVWSPTDLFDYCLTLVTNAGRVREGEKLWKPVIDAEK